MMRLPWFDYRAPRTLGEAARILAGEGPNASLIAGGTDLLPNMKRRQTAPKVLVSLRHIPELKRNGAVLGAGTTLSEIVRKPELPRGLRQAAAQVATVHLRNMGTLGGNLCLDTRCNYYNQNYEWRKAIDFCLKKDGDICWVATGKALTDEVIEEAGRLTASRAKPMDNADLDLYWRKDVTAAFVGYALRELRGDDMRETRQRIARYQPA